MGKRAKQWEQFPPLDVKPKRRLPAMKVCGMCGNWSKPDKCKEFAGSYPEDSPIADTCSNFKESKKSKKEE